MVEKTVIKQTRQHNKTEQAHNKPGRVRQAPLFVVFFCYVCVQTNKWLIDWLIGLCMGVWG